MSLSAAFSATLSAPRRLLRAAMPVNPPRTYVLVSSTPQPGGQP